MSAGLEESVGGAWWLGPVKWQIWSEEFWTNFWLSAWLVPLPMGAG